RRDGQVHREDHRQRRQRHENPKHGDDHEAGLGRWCAWAALRHGIRPCAAIADRSPCGAFAEVSVLSSHLPSACVQSLGTWTWTGAIVETDSTRSLAASRTTSLIMAGNLSAPRQVLFQTRSGP